MSLGLGDATKILYFYVTVQNISSIYHYITNVKNIVVRKICQWLKETEIYFWCYKKSYTISNKCCSFNILFIKESWNKNKKKCIKKMQLIRDRNFPTFYSLINVFNIRTPGLAWHNISKWNHSYYKHNYKRSLHWKTIAFCLILDFFLIVESHISTIILSSSTCRFSSTKHLKETWGNH